MEIYLKGVTISALLLLLDVFINAKIYNKIFSETYHPKMFGNFIIIIILLSWVGAFFSLLSIIHGLNNDKR